MKRELSIFRLRTSGAQVPLDSQGPINIRAAQHAIDEVLAQEREVVVLIVFSCVCFYGVTIAQVVSAMEVEIFIWTNSHTSSQKEDGSHCYHACY